MPRNTVHSLVGLNLFFTLPNLNEQSFILSCPYTYLNRGYFFLTFCNFLVDLNNYEQLTDRADSAGAGGSVFKLIRTTAVLPIIWNISLKVRYFFYIIFIPALIFSNFPIYRHHPLKRFNLSQIHM